MLEVTEENLTPEQKIELDKVLDEVVSIVVVHKPTLENAGKDVMTRHITAFAKAVVQSFKERFPDTVCEESDFAIVKVNFDTRNISILNIG